MPKTLPERIFFTIVMAAIMVYGMIVYNVALNTNGVTNATFVMALHEMPIMVPVAFVLEFFVVEKLATKLAFLFMRPTDRPQFITYAISLMIVCIMCPVMSLVATLLFKEPSFGMWVHTWGCNMPMALYIACSNVIGVFGVKPPTKDLDVTAALALMSIVLIEYAGVRARGGAGFLKSLAAPTPIMTP